MAGTEECPVPLMGQERYVVYQSNPGKDKKNILGEFAQPESGEKFMYRHPGCSGYKSAYVERQDGLDGQKKDSPYTVSLHPAFNSPTAY